MFNLKLYAGNDDIKTTVTDAVLYYYYENPLSAIHNLTLEEYISNFQKYKDVVEEDNCRKAKIYLSISIPKGIYCSFLVKYSDNKKQHKKELKKVMLTQDWQCFWVKL